MRLTDKQRQFCDDIANGCTQQDAYKRAYNCEAMKETTIAQRAHEEIRKPHIAAYIDEIVETHKSIQRASIEAEKTLAVEVIYKNGLTFGTWLDDAIHMRDEARADGDIKTALAAHKLIGDSMGFTKPPEPEPKQEVTINNNTLIVEDKWAKLQALLPAQ